MALLAGLAFWSSWDQNPTPPFQVRYTIDHPYPNYLVGPGAISPDSTKLVFSGLAVGSLPLHLRPIDQLDGAPIPGTEGGFEPFFSPDGQWIGFFSEGKLKKVSLSGGPPTIICDAPNGRGATWGLDDSIIFNPNWNEGLSRISASGKGLQVVSTLDHEKGENSHRWPDVLPDGKAVLFTVRVGGTFEDARIVVKSLETGEQRVLIEEGTYARYVPTGHIVFAREGSLQAVPFDLERLQITAPSVVILDNLSYNPNTGMAHFSASDNGTLVYRTYESDGPNRRLVWVDRTGKATPINEAHRAYSNPRFSPDGQKLAVTIGTTDSEVWVQYLAGGTLTRLTFEGRNDTPIWMAEGDRLIFGSTRNGPLNLFSQPSDASAKAVQLVTSNSFQWANSVSKDGRLLAYTEVSPTTQNDVWVASLQSEEKPRPLLQTPFDEVGAKFSPDGRWIAYTSNESGRWEVYVRPYPGPGGKLQISNDGGSQPVWAPNGQELFYRNGNRMMAVNTQTKPVFRVGEPKLLFEGDYLSGYLWEGGNYDVAPDGQRFVMIEEANDQKTAQVYVVLNWFEELKRLVPDNN